MKAVRKNYEVAEYRRLVRIIKPEYTPSLLETSF